MIEGQRDKIKACVGVMIWKDGNILLGKRRGKHGTGEYSCPGGHLEFGESLIDCAKRETKEEVGIEIKNIKFLSVANIFKHENRQDVLINFTADWDNGEVIDNPNEKIDDWEWFSIEELPKLIFYPTQVLIDSYKTGKNFYDIK